MSCAYTFGTRVSVRASPQQIRTARRRAGDSCTRRALRTPVETRTCGRTSALLRCPASDFLFLLALGPRLLAATVLQRRLLGKYLSPLLSALGLSLWSEIEQTTIFFFGVPSLIIFARDTRLPLSYCKSLAFFVPPLDYLLPILPSLSPWHFRAFLPVFWFFPHAVDSSTSPTDRGVPQSSDRGAYVRGAPRYGS